MRISRVSAATLLISVLTALAVTSTGVAAPASPGSAGTAPPDVPDPSTFIGTAAIEDAASVSTASDGDLWPSCWADDGNLYAANGDGKGFSLGGQPSDVAVSRIEGTPPNLTGETVATGDQVSQIWSGAGYNRKPTGMVCVGNTLYLAVQDLALDFNDVPAATIVKSTDGGRTWTWDHSAPMFKNHVFTTIWFADFGKGGAWDPDKYVYAYGLDNNWRDSFDDSVPDPQEVYLARVPKDRVADRKAWEFYAGGTEQKPAWSKAIGERQPVLRDTRRRYQQTYSTDHPTNLSVISQGGVTYDPGLHRYLYASWTEYTFEFYESPTPWGPWKQFLSKDFGGYPWSTAKHGGYATTIPSKFVSPDGRSMWVQSNVCPCGGGGASVYDFSLRRMTLTPSSPAPAANEPDDGVDLADHDAVPISKSSHFGRLDRLNDGDLTTGEDDFDDEVKTRSWWGYTWPAQHHLDRVDFTSGQVFDDGGWFTGRPVVEVRRNGVWAAASSQTITPAYDPTKPFTTYTISFAPVDADGVRVAGVPGGSRTFTSAAELAARYATQVTDGGFEAPVGGASAWGFEGTANHGVDRGLGFSHSGANNGWIRTSDTGWSAYTQSIPVKPGATYTFSAWTRSSDALAAGRFGVLSGDAVLAEQSFGATADYEQRTVTVKVPEGVHSITLYAGFDGPGTDTWLQLDDVTVAQG